MCSVYDVLFCSTAHYRRFGRRRELGGSTDLLRGERERLAAQLVGVAVGELAQLVDPTDDDEPARPGRQQERAAAEPRRHAGQGPVRQPAEPRQVAEQRQAAGSARQLRALAARRHDDPERTCDDVMQAPVEPEEREDDQRGGSAHRGDRHPRCRREHRHRSLADEHRRPVCISETAAKLLSRLSLSLSLSVSFSASQYVCLARVVSACVASLTLWEKYRRRNRVGSTTVHRAPPKRRAVLYRAPAAASAGSRHRDSGRAEAPRPLPARGRGKLGR